MGEDSAPGTGVESAEPENDPLGAGLRLVPSPGHAFPVADRLTGARRPLPGPAAAPAPDPIRVAIEDALAAAQHKQEAARARLIEAHEEAQSLIRDAADQAMLVGAAAEQAAERVLAEARAEAEQERAQAKLTATAFRAQAEQILLGAQREADQRHANLAADLTRSWDEHERELRELHAVAQAEATAVGAAADQHAASLLEQAQVQAARLLGAAESRLAAAERDVTARQAAATEQAAALLDSARDQAGRELAAAAEQTAWTQQVVTGLLEAATAEAGLIRGQAHAEAAAALRRVRLRVSGVLASATSRQRQRRGELEHDIQAAADHGSQLLAEAGGESAAILAMARQQAEALLTDAEEAAAGHHDRAERRLAEAEAGARAVREQVAEQVGHSQREMYELRRAAKAEANLLVSDARAVAEDLRALADQLLAEARAEVAALTERRDAIAAELSELSGVIEALAVADGQDRPASAAGPVGLEPVGLEPVGLEPVGLEPVELEPVEPVPAVEAVAEERRPGHADAEDVGDSDFLLEHLMRAVNDPGQQRSVPDGNAWLRARRGRSAAG